MKILKGIITGIGVLAALLCALIIMSAVNPGVTEGLSSLLSGDGFSSGEDEQAEENPEFRQEEDSFEETPDLRDVLDSLEMPELEDTASDIAPEEEQTEEEEEPRETVARQPDIPVADSTDDEPGEERVRGTNGYEQPLQSEVDIPTIVRGKTGYQPITEQSEAADENEYSGLNYGELGDGLTFDPVFYPYYQMLDDKGQHVYRQIYANAVAMNEAFIPIEEVTMPEIKNAITAVYNDHPELFWLNTIFTCKYDRDRICAELVLDFNMTQEELDEAAPDFYNTTNNILTELANLGPYDKERKLHDILIRRIDYDKSADMNQSAYSALVEGKSVCAGYARAYQYLMQKLGIPCYYCTGYAGQDHAWNIVALDDGYYNVDLTWDDTPGYEYDYFNKTDEDYASTHIRQDLSINLPQCQGQRYRSL